MNIRRKLKQNNGETLIEVLVSLLIICLCLLMLSYSIDSSVKVIKSANEKMDEYYKKNNILADGLNGDEYEDGTITFKNGNSNCVLVLGTSSTINVTYYINDAFSSNEVIAYLKKQ